MKPLATVVGLAVLATAVHCAADETAVPAGALGASSSGGSAPPEVPDATTVGDAQPDAPLGPPQGAGAVCTQDAECQSGGCDDTGHCALGRSCTQRNGGRTCGPDAAQSCCSSAAVSKPGGAFVLDTYSVTAGRFRAFIDRTGDDVRGYVQAHRPDWFAEAWLPWLPNVMDDGTSAAPGGHAFAAGAGQNGVYQQLGPIHYGEEGGGNEGCLTSQVGNARTYRLPDDVNTSLFGDVQQYPQDVLDQKPMQCTTFYMFAAFCIWDGGRIPTLGELDYAWDGGDPDGHLYPWGNAPAPGGWDHPYPFMPDGTFGVHAPEGSDITFANYRYNFWMPAQMTCLGDDANKCDYSLYLAPPGRFPKGNGPFGHADLAGDVYNVAMPPDDVDAGSDPATMQAGLERTGAFDKHAIPKARPVAGFRTYTATNKYLAVGARCAR